jgi:hypothetical protein
MQHGETSPLPFHPLKTCFSNESMESDYPLSAHDAKRMGDIVSQEEAPYSRMLHAESSGDYKSPPRHDHHQDKYNSPGERQAEGTYGHKGAYVHPPHPGYHSSTGQHPEAGYHSSHYPYHHPVHSGLVDSSYSNYPPYSVPYAVHAHAAPSFESHGSSMSSGPYGHVLTYSYGPHPVAYPQPFPAWSAPPPQIQYVKNINPADVLCGRGGATNSHSGNRAFRLLVKQFQGQYLRAKKAEKPSVASKVVDLVRERGGRFLRRCDTLEKGNVLWVDIGDDRAREKSCQALREGAPELRKKKRAASLDDDSRRTRRKGTDGISTCSSPDRSRGNSPFRKWDTREDESDVRKDHSDVLDSDARDDSEGNRGDSASVEKKEPIVVRPCARLLKRSTTTEITLEELTPHEKELYLSDFLPPDPDIRQGSKRRDVFRAARRYEPVCRDDDDESSGDGSWVAAV